MRTLGKTALVAIAMICVALAVIAPTQDAVGDGGETAWEVGPVWLAGGNGLDVYAKKGEGISGRKNYLDRNVVKTHKQRLHAHLIVTPYRPQKQNDPKYDYYAFTGHFTHSVAHSPTHPVKNWLSVGYYAQFMKLNISIDGTHGQFVDYGPATSTGSSTTGFSIGGDLAVSLGTDLSGKAAISGGWSTSHTVSDVTVIARPTKDMLNWRVELPCVNFLSAGIPANPYAASYGSFTFRFAFIAKFEKGHKPAFQVDPKVQWVFDYTRGIHADYKTWHPDLEWKPDPK